VKTQNYKVVDITEGYKFEKKIYLNLTSYKNDIIFPMRQALVRNYYAAEILYYFSCIIMISNIKTQNYKFVDLIESYNFHVESIFI
jgi:hypothetical protein